MRPGSGLANWKIFSRRLLEVYRAYQATHGRIPGNKVLRRLGHQNLVSAAYHHHHGFRHVYQRLKISSGELPSNTAEMERTSRPRTIHSLEDWPTLAKKLRPVIEQFFEQHHRVPLVKELHALGHGPLVSACQDYHFGYSDALVRFGYQPNHKKRGRKSNPLGKWSYFQEQAWPVWELWLRKWHRLPSRRDLLDQHRGDLVYAVNRFYGGMRQVHVKLGFSLDQQKRYGRNPDQNWYDQSVRQKFLERHFPERLAWGTAPTLAMVKSVHHGLAEFSEHLPGGWLGLMAEHGLVASRVGNTQRRRAQVIIWALDFFESHGRWPTKQERPAQAPTELPVAAATWERYVTATDFNPKILSRLVTRWERHNDWCYKHRLHRIQLCRQTINRLIIARAEYTHLRPSAF